LLRPAHAQNNSFNHPTATCNSSVLPPPTSSTSTETLTTSTSTTTTSTSTTTTTTTSTTTTSTNSTTTTTSTTSKYYPDKQYLEVQYQCDDGKLNKSEFKMGIPDKAVELAASIDDGKVARSELRHVMPCLCGKGRLRGTAN
jgi:hypothetical protein